jgi:hypothetical protein
LERRGDLGGEVAEEDNVEDGRNCSSENPLRAVALGHGRSAQTRTQTSTRSCQVDARGK